MHGLTTAEVMAPLADAGCFCCLPASYYETKAELLDEVKKVRDQTDQPFGINVGLFPEMNPTAITAEVRIDWVIESGVKILETAGRSPEPQRKQISDAGLIHIHKCARVRDAIKAEKVGVDIVSIVGTECGGHPSMEEVGFIVLIPCGARRDQRAPDRRRRDLRRPLHDRHPGPGSGRGEHRDAVHGHQGLPDTPGLQEQARRM